MCGISGVVALKGGFDISQRVCEMNDLIAHRGPDGEGFYLQEGFALGHRRLSILDLSEAGHQPMHSACGRYVITYNGEIYNYLEIKKELQKTDQNFQFKSGTDTEVILAAYAHWGKDCVQRFNGMWSFCIHDRQKNTLFCSRDRFGIKPFYYTKQAECFAFGSEIKQLVSLLPTRKINQALLADFLVIGYEEHITDQTFFVGIHKLPPAHNLIYDLQTHRFDIERYYTLRPNETLADVDLPTAIATTQTLFTDAVRLRLRSDVRVGTCLSGGLDSSAISATAARMYTFGACFTGLHAKSIDRQTDESNFAQILATHTGLDLQIITPDPPDLHEIARQLVYIQEEPYGGPSIVMQYYIFEAAKRLGIPVMLDGQGGDEVFVGYERYFASYVSQLSPHKKWQALRAFSQTSGIPFHQLLLQAFYFTNETIRKKRLLQRAGFLKKDIIEQVNFDLMRASINSFKSGLSDLQQLELTTIQLPHLLRYEDKNSMHFSIEARLPMLDYRLVEGVLGTPDAYKIQRGWSKYLLRTAAEGNLPSSIAWRRSKLGFNAPEVSWFAKYRKVFQETIEASGLLAHITKQEVNFETLDNKTLWRLYSTALWMEAFDVGWE